MLIKFIKYLLKPHLISLIFLGLNSGLAFILLANSLTTALSYYGFSASAIGCIFLSSLPYALKVLWAPLMDYYSIPVLGKLLGQRRSWLLISQLGLFISSLGFILTPTNNSLWVIGVIGTVFVFFAASQDIALDAYRIERLAATELAIGSTFSITGFRIGCLIGGALPLYLLEITKWSKAFTIISLTLLIGPFITLIVKEPSGIKRNTSVNLPNAVEHLRSVFNSLLDFLNRNDWWLIILFIFFYKIGDTVPNAMKGPLLASMEFTKMETANISQLYGVLPMILGGFLASGFVFKLGLFRSIVIASVAQLLSPFMYAWLTLIGHNLPALLVTTTVHNLCCGLASTILVIYISSLCNKGTAATQYALIYSFGSLTRTLLSSTSGIFADYTDWTTFFIGTTLMCLPVFWIIKKLSPVAITSTSK